MNYKIIVLAALVLSTNELHAQQVGPAVHASTGHVRTGIGHCEQELQALVPLIHKAQKELETTLHMLVALKTMPLIGACTSGGGFRAAVALLGLLKGLEKIGLLNTLMYLSTLSGSTWTAAAWLTQNKSLDELEQYLRGKMNSAMSLNLKKITPETTHLKIWDKILIKLVAKLMTKRPITMNDIYGSILGDVFLDTNDGTAGQQAYLADLAPKVASGGYPIPIFTAVVGQPHKTDQPMAGYQWVEFTPFEIGSSFLHAWIHPNDFGKTFYNGITSDPNKPEDFAYILGILGAAYALGLRDIINNASKILQAKIEAKIAPQVSSKFSWLINKITNVVVNVVDKIASFIRQRVNTSKLLNDNTILTNLLFAVSDIHRFSPPIINNFTYGIPGSPLEHEKYMTLIDAGYDINLPMQPLLRRHLNIYIICDASADALFGKGSELKKVVAYAKKNNLPFPEISFKDIDKKPVSIFYDENNPNVPTVIYIPNMIETSTFNFDYDEKIFTAIMTGIENAVINNKERILQAFKRVVSNLETTRGGAQHAGAAR